MTISNPARADRRHRGGVLLKRKWTILQSHAPIPETKACLPAVQATINVLTCSAHSVSREHMTGLPAVPWDRSFNSADSSSSDKAATSELVKLAAQDSEIHMQGDRLARTLDGTSRSTVLPRVTTLPLRRAPGGLRHPPSALQAVVLPVFRARHFRYLYRAAAAWRMSITAL